VAHVPVTRQRTKAGSEREESAVEITRNSTETGLGPVDEDEG
jgi:hypothetical protein